MVASTQFAGMSPAWEVNPPKVWEAGSGRAPRPLLSTPPRSHLPPHGASVPALAGAPLPALHAPTNVMAKDGRCYRAGSPEALQQARGARGRCPVTRPHVSWDSGQGLRAECRPLTGVSVCRVRWRLWASVHPHGESSSQCWEIGPPLSGLKQLLAGVWTSKDIWSKVNTNLPFPHSQDEQAGDASSGLLMEPQVPKLWEEPRPGPCLWAGEGQPWGRGLSPQGRGLLS